MKKTTGAMPLLPNRKDYGTELEYQSALMDANPSFGTWLELESALIDAGLTSPTPGPEEE